MGLHKFKDGNKNDLLMLWAVPAIIIGISIVIMLGGEPGKEWLRYDRVWIGQGEAWRFLTGHFTHLGWSHLALNSAGLLLIWFLIGQSYTFFGWLQIAFVTVATIDTAFWFLNPELYWYVGMSGLLHGLLVAGIITRLRNLDIETGVLLLLLIAKIGYEQLNGPLPGSEGTSGGAVVVDAHLYGALGGALGALLAKIRASTPASI
jgi:rhomboid family GlyGly-CTERM serine protease